MVISKQHVGIADPHRRLQMVRQESGSVAGKLLKLSELMKHNGHANCLSGVFGMTAGMKSYDATLFRFPLRQENSGSKISQNCYTPTKIRDNLFSSLKEEAPILLLFLKHVLKVSMFEWKTESNSPECTFCIEISENVTSDRTRCAVLAKDYDITSSKTSVVITTGTTTTTEYCGGKAQHHWLMLHAIGSDLDELRMHADRTKVLPWVGIAAPAPKKLNLSAIEIDLESVSDKNSIDQVESELAKLQKHACELIEVNVITGQAFCFLPLPGSISLPVNLHGYFAVADNRRSIKWPSHDEKGDDAKWNEMLLHNLVSPLYALLLMCRSSLFQYKGTSIDVPINDAYAAWPVYAEVKNQHIWSNILQPVLERIVNLPILWAETRNGGAWVKPADAVFVDLDRVCPQVALKVLIDLGYNVVSLSPKILETMLTHEEMKQIITTQYVTAELVQRAIRSKTGIMNMVPREDAYQLLKYVLSHQPDCHALMDLEVLPLCNASEFATLNDKQVFLFPQMYKDCLRFLPGIISVVVDTNVSYDIQEKLEELSRREVFTLTLVTPDIICHHLIELSMKSWYPHLGERYCIWQPGHSNHPPIEWITNVWVWIRTLKNIQMVSHLPLVPEEVVTPSSKNIRLLPLNTSPGLCRLPVDRHPEQCPPDIMLNLVKMVDLVCVEQSNYVFQCPDIDRYIKICDAHFLLKHIEKQLESFSSTLTSKKKDSLRHYIACDIYASHLSPEESCTIKNLPIFKAGVGGSCSKYTSLQPGCVLPPRGFIFRADIEYPPDILCDEDDYVTSLLEELGVARSMTIDEFCKNIILPYVMKNVQQNQNVDQLVMCVLQCPLMNPEFLKDFKIIKTSIHSHHRIEPTKLYDPTELVFCNLYDSKSEAVFPADDYNEVLPVLRQAGLKTWSTVCSSHEQMTAFFVDRAKSLSRLSKLDGIERSKYLLQHLLQHGLINDPLFSNIPFLFPQQSPPSNYPLKLKWFGESKSHIVLSPQDICCSMSEAYLVGSVVPVLSSEYNVHEQHKGFHNITTKDIVDHFKEVVLYTELPKSDGDQVHDMVMKVYQSLHVRSHTDMITDFPQKWIWWQRAKQFLTPAQCIFNLPTEIVTLEPYLFCLSSNPELQKCVSSLLQFLPQVQLHPSLTKEHAVTTLHKINQPRGTLLSSDDLNMAVRVLKWLKSDGQHTHGDILIPTSLCTLAPTSECTYDDRNWKNAGHKLQKSKYMFVHEDIPPALAKHLQVEPLSKRVAPSEGLKVRYTKAGQHEPFTRRLRRIVEDYATSSDIFKELLQNADDAKATEVKFLIDWREHPKSQLLVDELSCWQGPALIAYNNAVFSDQDFNHICELAAETKMNDPLKTGRFGVGFCATYHMTDVPSFISRRNFTMFDPHTFYLGDRVSTSEPGIRIDLVENKEDLQVYCDQFQPFNGLFECDVFNLTKDGFPGTLFRFPFRTSETAKRSEICREVNNHESIKRLLQDFRNQAPYLTLFLKHVRKISVLVLDSKAKNPSRMERYIEIEKTCECVPCCSRVSLISKNVQDVVGCNCQCKVQIQLHRQHEETSQWIICSAISPTVKLRNKKHQGLVPFAEVAFKVCKENNGGLSPVTSEGYTFCFLPLPIKTGLPFHVNGFFEISRDRSSLKSSDDQRFGKEWNDSLCREPLLHAYITALSQLTLVSPIQHSSIADKKNHLRRYYDMFKLTDKKDMSSLSSAAKKGLPTSDEKLIWSDVNGGRWLRPRDIVILDFDVVEKQMQTLAIDVLHILGYNACELPNHLVQLLIDFLRKDHRVYNCQKFYAEVLLPNVRNMCIPTDLRDEHICFLLMNYDHFKWIDTLLRKECFVPVRACARLVCPDDLIDGRQPLMACLYDPEEGRFPGNCLNDERVMVSLAQLGMPKELSIADIIDRAHTVQKLYFSDRDKAIKRCWNLLRYVQKCYISYFVSRHEKLTSALSGVSFLPAASKPYNQIPWYDASGLVKPCSVFIPKWNNVIFSVCPVILQPEKYQLHSDILLLVGASQKPPLELVIEHLLNLSSEPFEGELLSYISQAMGDIYKYMQSTIKPYESEVVSIAKKKLQQAKFIWQENRFLSTDQLALKWGHNCCPYLCKLSSENMKYRDLFVLLGVREKPAADDLVNLLCKIAGKPTSHVEGSSSDSAVCDTEDIISEQVIDFIEEIVKKLSEHVRKVDKRPPPNLYLPDENCVMRPVRHLACDKVDTNKEDWVHSMDIFKSQFGGGVCHFIHPSIPRERAITLGVKPLLDALLHDLEDVDFLKGSDYGQYEDLCDRLKSILNKYPSDHSIFNEFVQNADDAQATEIVFVLDRRKFSQEKLFPSRHDSWKELQHTPALCVMNNRKFTEDDIKGILQLGRGGKRNSSDTIGQFGIGFNAAYHITDCPSFVSFSEGGEPENFCVFDPTCSFANTTKSSPGKRWKIYTTPDIVQDMPGQFEPYMLENMSFLKDLDKGHVVFRLPLTRRNPVPRPYYRSTMTSVSGRRKGLSTTSFDAKGITQLFMEMENFSCDTLLFLNHVTKLSAFEIKENGDILEHFSTQTTLSPEMAVKCHEFARHVKEITRHKREPKSLTVSYKTEVLHRVPLKCTGPTQRQEWLIYKTFSPIGYAEDEGSVSGEKASEWNMRPLGGIAAAMGKVALKGRFFCFLPMPLESKLPVHVNGHFLVDDSRKHLEGFKKKHMNWNASLATNVIAPCYVDVLLHAQQMTQRGNADPKWFYNLFPSLSSEGEVGNLKLAESVYRILFERNPEILLQRHPDTGAVKWFSLQGPNMGHFFQSYISSTTHKKVPANPALQCALIRLGMPITTEEVPCKLHENMTKVIKDYSAIVKPQTVFNHLKHGVTISLMESVLNIDTIQTLVDFLIQGMTCEGLKKTLEAVPLLLSCDNHLWKGKEIYRSEHVSLLPHCSAHFIDKELEECSAGNILASEEYRVIVDLPVRFVSKHIDLQNARQAVKISEMSSGIIHLTRNLWMYLKSLCVASVSKVMKYYFPLKCVLPADDGYLYPVCQSNVILSSNGGNIHIRRALTKLGYAKVSFKKLGITEPICYGDVLGNKCLDGDDIIQCVKGKDPLIKDAELSLEEVRCFIDNVRDHSLDNHAKNLLRSLKIFKTVDGTFMSMTGKPSVYVMPHNVPKGGIACIQEMCRTSYVILDGTDEFTVTFYRSILSIITADEVQFYRHVILPHMHGLQIDHQKDHLRYISCNNNLRIQLRRELGKVQFIPISDNVYSITQLYDPNSTFFTNFCSEQLLPEPWIEEGEEWLPFFKELGLRHKVEIGEWIRHARLFALQHRDSKLMAVASKALLNTLFDMLNEHPSPNSESLNEISTIAFICNDSNPARLITMVKQVFGSEQNDMQKGKLFCFKGSVLSVDSDLAALCRNVLPVSCFEKLRGFYHDFRIESPVSATTIVQNLKELSKVYTCIHSSQQSWNMENLRKIVVQHYTRLDSCSDLSSIDVGELKETLCIAVGPVGSLSLVKPSQLVRSIPSGINVEPLFYEVPSNISQCINLLDALEVPQELSAVNCVEILQKISQQLQQTRGKLSNHDRFKRVALGAYHHMVCLLRKSVETLPDTLYLPSVDDELIPNSDLLFNDAMWYAERLPKDEVFQYLKLPPPDDKGEKIPPDSLHVKWLTSVMSEELHEDMFSSDWSCTEEECYTRDNSKPRCRSVQNIYNTLRSPLLKKGLRRVYFSEYKEKPSEKFEEALETLESVKIQCVTSPRVVTVLKKNDTVIANSESRDKYCHLSIEAVNDICLVIAPHDKKWSEVDFIQNLSSVLKALSHNEIRNEVYLMAMLRCEPEEIEAELDKLKVCHYNPVSVKETKYQQIGDDVESLTLEDCLIFINYDVGEMVNYYNESSGTITTAKVVKVSSEGNFWEKTVTLKVSTTEEDSEVEVSPIFIFKLLTPPQQILLFSDLTDQSSVLATAEPVHLVSVPIREDDLDTFLINSPFHQGLSVMSMMRLIIHVHYMLVKKENCRVDLKNDAIDFLQELDTFLSSVDHHTTSVAHHILEIASSSLRIPEPMVSVCSEALLDYDGRPSIFAGTCNVMPQIVPQSQTPVALSTLQLQSQTPVALSTSQLQSQRPVALSTSQLQPPPVGQVNQPSSSTQYQSRFQPHQRRRAHQPQQTRRYRFQPQPSHTVEPPEPPLPPISERNAQLWLEQAKMDYKAALYLMGTASITPKIVPPPQECASQDQQDDEGLEDDSSSSESEISSLPDKYTVDRSTNGSDVQEEVCNVSQNHPQFPALVCFLCHEAVEKCIKGVMYCFCGLKPELVNCSTLVTLWEDLKNSGYCPQSLMIPIEQCVMQVNEHQSKSRFPNFQMPPCAPATAYNVSDAQEALIAADRLFQSLNCDQMVAPMLGTLEEVPLPQFTSMLKSLAGSDGKNKMSWLVNVVYRDNSAAKASTDLPQS